MNLVTLDTFSLPSEEALIVVVGGFIYFDSSNVRCLRRHEDVLGSGFRGFPSDVDASENVTANFPL